MNLFKWFLFPISIIFWFITSLRNFFYDFGWLKSSGFNLPIIGIGNITVGGTGKTPLTSYITKLLSEENKIAILSKGYGRKTRDFNYVELDSKIISVGDEPMQTKQNFPNQIVAVDHKRVNGVLNILSDHPETSAIILDDSFQHRSIKIGYNILLIDYNRPIYKDYLLPIGFLRETSKGIKRANCIVVTKCPEHLTKNEAEEIKEKINFNGDIFFSKVKYEKIIALNNKNKSLNYNQINDVLLVTAIAQNKPIINYLESKNINCSTFRFRDHHNYNKKDIEDIINKKETLNDNTIILTTEKDAQKLKDFSKLNDHPVYYLKVSVDFLWNKDKFDQKLFDYVRNNQENS